MHYTCVCSDVSHTNDTVSHADSAMKKNDCSHRRVSAELVSVVRVYHRGQFDSLTQKNQHQLHVDSGIKS